VRTSLNLVVALAFVGLSLLLGVVISLLAGLSSAIQPKEATTELLAALDDDEDRLMRARSNLRIACAYAAGDSSSIVQMLTTETAQAQSSKATRLNALDATSAPQSDT
jgi:hypothetical protein